MKQINQPSIGSWILLFSLAIIWGVNFLFIKIAVTDVGPITNVFCRLFMASIILYICMRFTGNKIILTRTYLVFYVSIGALGSAIPFYLISDAERIIDAGIAGVLMSPMPLITLALSALILKDQNINLIEELPFNLNIPKSCDDGKPYCFDYKDEYSLKFENITNAITKKFQS